MRAVIEFAMDREVPEMLRDFVEPLDRVLRSAGAGGVLRCDGERPGMTMPVRLKLVSAPSLDIVRQFLAEVDAPVGTIVYRLDWLGRKQDITMLGPTPVESDRS